MKTKRFFSVFLLIALMMSLCCVPMASADETTPTITPPPDILAKAALLVDPETDAIAYAKNEHQELYPASLTKIMTALLVLEAVEKDPTLMDQEITVTSAPAWRSTCCTVTEAPPEPSTRAFFPAQGKGFSI